MLEAMVLTHSLPTEKFHFGKLVQNEMKKRDESVRNSSWFREIILFGNYGKGRPGNQPSQNARFFLSSGTTRFLKNEKGLCLISNSQEFCKILEPLLRRAEYMFHNKAYLHHFSNFGIDSSFINKSLAIVRYIIHIYNQI